VGFLSPSRQITGYTLKLMTPDFSLVLTSPPTVINSYNAGLNNICS